MKCFDSDSATTKDMFHVKAENVSATFPKSHLWLYTEANPDENIWDWKDEKCDHYFRLYAWSDTLKR